MRSIVLLVFASSIIQAFYAIDLVIAYHQSTSLNDVSTYTFSILHCIQLATMPALAIASFIWIARD